MLENMAIYGYSPCKRLHDSLLIPHLGAGKQGLATLMSEYFLLHHAFLALCAYLICWSSMIS